MLSPQTFATHLARAVELFRDPDAKASQKMDFDDVDRNPAFALNEIIWKSVKGADSRMPLPVHSYQFK